jgi:hypothetical protein
MNKLYMNMIAQVVEARMAKSLLNLIAKTCPKKYEGRERLTGEIEIQVTVSIYS